MERGDIMVVKVEGPYGIKAIGCNSLWCFTYGKGWSRDWSSYSTNDVVYAIIDFSEDSDSADFMHVVIKPIIYNSDDEEINDESVFDMSNRNVNGPMNFLDYTIGIETAKQLLDFDIEPEEEEEEEEEKEYVDPNQLSLFECVRILIKTRLNESLSKHLDFRVEMVDAYSGQENMELGLYMDGEIIGLVEYVLFNGELTISDIVVVPKYRRKGFGSRMIQYLKKYHSDYTYVPSMKTDLGAKFKHKEINGDITQFKGSLDETVFNEDVDKTGCDCCKYFDWTFSLAGGHYGGLNHPIYYAIEKGERNELRFISPEEYMRAIARGFHMSYEESLKSGAINWDTVKKYANDMKNGDKFPIGWYKNSTGGQEGRHRALALIEVGCKTMPVVVMSDVDRDEVKQMVIKYKDLPRETLNRIYVDKGYKGISDLDWRTIRSYVEYRL